MALAQMRRWPHDLSASIIRLHVCVLVNSINRTRYIRTYQPQTVSIIVPTVRSATSPRHPPHRLLAWARLLRTLGRAALSWRRVRCDDRRQSAAAHHARGSAATWARTDRTSSKASHINRTLGVQRSSLRTSCFVSEYSSFALGLVDHQRPSASPGCEA